MRLNSVSVESSNPLELLQKKEILNFSELLPNSFEKLLLRFKDTKFQEECYKYEAEVFSVQLHLN